MLLLFLPSSTLSSGCNHCYCNTVVGATNVGLSSYGSLFIIDIDVDIDVFTINGQGLLSARPTCCDAGVEGGCLVLGGPRAQLVTTPPKAPVKVVLVLGIFPVTEIFVEEALVCKGYGKLWILSSLSARKTNALVICKPKYYCECCAPRL